MAKKSNNETKIQKNKQAVKNKNVNAVSLPESIRTTEALDFFELLLRERFWDGLETITNEAGDDPVTLKNKLMTILCKINDRGVTREFIEHETITGKFSNEPYIETLDKSLSNRAYDTARGIFEKQTLVEQNKDRFCKLVSWYPDLPGDLQKKYGELVYSGAIDKNIIDNVVKKITTDPKYYQLGIDWVQNKNTGAHLREEILIYSCENGVSDIVDSFFEIESYHEENWGEYSPAFCVYHALQDGYTKIAKRFLPKAAPTSRLIEELLEGDWSLSLIPSLLDARNQELDDLSFDDQQKKSFYKRSTYRLHGNNDPLKSLNYVYNELDIDIKHGYKAFCAVQNEEVSSRTKKDNQRVLDWFKNHLTASQKATWTV